MGGFVMLVMPFRLALILSNILAALERVICDCSILFPSMLSPLYGSIHFISFCTSNRGSLLYRRV